MDNDDRPVGRVLTRREMLKLLASVTAAAAAASCVPRATGTSQATAVPTATEEAIAAATTAPTATAAAATATTAPAATTAATVAATATTETEVAAAATVLPTCVVRPEMTEGPYFVDEMINRADIRSDPTTGEVKDGVPLALTFAVSRIGDMCEPLPGATVDIWHCDATGVYSDVNDAFFGNTVGQKFLRGYQVTDENGLASFTTIYPGWYSGRTVHIHFKIRMEESGRNYEFTSQLFFDDSLTDDVFTQQPYATKGERDTRNNNDGIYRNGGDQLLLNLTPTAEGYAATFDIGLDMS
ncbi:MAG: intradiol ring-cleavage dioxygenase [Chloroflexota bacterium]